MTAEAAPTFALCSACDERIARTRGGLCFRCDRAARKAERAPYVAAWPYVLAALVYAALLVLLVDGRLF